MLRGRDDRVVGHRAAARSDAGRQRGRSRLDRQPGGAPRREAAVEHEAGARGRASRAATRGARRSRRLPSS